METLPPISSPLPPTPLPVPAAEQTLFFNRDLSWLDFNWRVLHEATDPRNPLLERIKFLAIFASNQDEFYMKRVGHFKRRLAHHATERSLDNLNLEQQLQLIRQRLLTLTQEQVALWQEELQPALQHAGILIQPYPLLSAELRSQADDYFLRQVFPVLTPLAVDPGHPFPFISNLSLSLGILLRNPGQREHLFARVKVPQLFSRWLSLRQDRATYFVPLESIIEARLEMLFPGMEILETQPFRVTRNAEVETETEDPEDLLEVVQEELRARRFADTVRVQIPPAMSQEMRHYLLEGLEITSADLCELPHPLGMIDLMAIANLDRPELKIALWKPDSDPALADLETPIFALLRKGDVLVHHPYESFDTSVERFVLSAVNDPKVLAIKMTLYRTSGDSPFVPALARAAESGKQVAVLVELQARFDEERNIQWAQALENAGVHVIYGVLGLKTHTKTTLIVRREDEKDAGGGGGGGVRCYAHIATGNYNSKTAQQYTDLGLLTCREDICQDIVDLFAYLTGRSLKRDYRKLLVAPLTMRQRFVAMIEREMPHAQAGNGAGGLIIAKMNALEDPQIIQTLYRASAAGVKIELFVRGFCCLRPGVAGLSENIRVTSIIGRFLEHSRFFYFQNGGGAGEEFYLGSADWMTRNLSHRVEAAVPIEEGTLKEDLRQIIEIMREDNRNAWDLQADGTWVQRHPQEGETERGTQQRLMELADQRARAAKIVRLTQPLAAPPSKTLSPM